MIPQEKTAAVTRSLQQTFGVSTYDEIDLLAKSMTALVYRIAINGQPYLLRLIECIGDSSCECQFSSARAADKAGLAPRVHYTSLEDRIAITDFVIATPLSQQTALSRMPATLRTLHALPSFAPREDHLNTSCSFLLGSDAAIESLTGRFRSACLLTDSDSKTLFNTLAQIRSVYPRHDAEWTSCHNDLVRPGNILFDNRQIWLIDWEAAFFNDRYSELAVVANFVATSESELESYLGAYFGHPPSDYQRARFYLMQQLAHCFYSMVYLLLGSGGKPIDWTEEPPGFHEFHHRVWTGEADMNDSRMKIAYGKVHWLRLAHNLQTPRFSEALEIVSHHKP